MIAAPVGAAPILVCGDLCCLEPRMFDLKSHQLRRVVAMSVALGVSRSVAEWLDVPPVPPPPPQPPA